MRIAQPLARLARAPAAMRRCKRSGQGHRWTYNCAVVPDSSASLPVDSRSAHPPTAQSPADWRRRMRRQLAWSLLAKLAALAALWWLFFSGAHQAHLTRQSMGERLGFTSTADRTHDWESVTR